MGGVRGDRRAAFPPYLVAADSECGIPSAIAMRCAVVTGEVAAADGANLVLCVPPF